ELARALEPAIEWRVGDAEDVRLPEPVDLVTIGNAFHRLDGDRVAARAWQLLRPGGALALLWTHVPWDGDEPWQAAMAGVVDRWSRPSGGDASADPLPQVLFRNGFASHERIEIPHDERWTVDDLVGFARSTSVLGDAVVGDDTAAFDAELRSVLLRISTTGRFDRSTTAALDLARSVDASASAARVVQRIRALADARRPVVVAIDGRSGGGKSTLAAEVARSLPSCSVIEGDEFYAGGSDEHWDSLSDAERAAFCIDWRRQRPVLASLRRGEPGTWYGFDWDRFDGTLATEPTTCAPAGVVILEGAYSARPELADLLDLRVLVDVPHAVRRDRCIARDGDDWHEDWFQRWRAAEDHYFGEIVPADGFDLVLRSN
ncbi:MAG: methyltransferase domain-containing protein, partial [Actinomycetota bacterium]